MGIPELVVSTGDPQGIGPEVSVRAARKLLESEELRVVLAGNIGMLEELAGGTLQAPDAAAGAGLYALSVVSPAAPPEPPPSAAGGVAALAALEAALARVLKGPDRALVTAPVSKEAVTAAGIPFTGHTGWLRDRLGSPRTLMLFVAEELRLALATEHLPLRDVSGAITRDGLLGSMRLLDGWLRRHLVLEAPRLAILGLNPHAGEGGLLGSEELDVIRPAIELFNAEGGSAEGPFSADSFFAGGKAGDADGILAMYHDQGLLPVKSLAFGRAVNVTVGLPIVRTSVDHGCAYGLAGRGTADAGSMHEALDLARHLLRTPGR